MTDGGTPGDRLEQAAQARREHRGLRTRLEAATTHADGTTARVQATRDALAVAETDVDRLERPSWSRILSSLRGSAATDLEREKAERDAASYTLHEAAARDETAWRDVEALQHQLDALGDVESSYAAALAAQEEWAAAHDPAAAESLRVVADRRGALLAEDGEGRQAHAAGLVARDHLLHARDLLASARSWSTWDTFGGGGMLTDMMKYDKLDDVSRVLRDADVALERFSRELADVRLAGAEAVNLDGMTRAFDVFFDNIFTDLRVRSRIQDAEQRVGRTLASVESTLNQLTRRGRQIASELDGLARQREQVLLG